MACALQVFGKDTVLNMGARETKESREQWLEDIEMKACRAPIILCPCCSPMTLACIFLLIAFMSTCFMAPCPQISAMI